MGAVTCSGCPISVAASLAAPHSVKVDQAMLRLVEATLAEFLASIVSSKHCNDLYYYYVVHA